MMVKARKPLDMLKLIDKMKNASPRSPRRR